MVIPYSIIMSVYKKEKPDNLRKSMESMLNQTFPCAQFVLVCDGPLTEDLDEVIEEFTKHHPVIKTVRLPDNRGLGQALNRALEHCRNDIVVRMDSDDIAHLDRCEKQIAFMQERQLDLCSAAVDEFVAGGHITGRRSLPETHEELLRFARKRNPMNHPCAAFRKSMAEKAGNYRHMPLFEDYDLWARMILAGACLGNYGESLLYMRAGDELYRRRSGLIYCRHTVRFWREMRRIGFCTWRRAWANIFIRCIVSLLPVKGVRFLYQKKLRTNSVQPEDNFL